MPVNFDVSKLSQSAARKTTPHDNCTVLDLGTGNFPRDIEVRLPDDDGARQIAVWDGSFDLAINDEVFCNEYGGNPKWRIASMGGADSGAGKVRVSKVWKSGFDDVALTADADGDIGIGTEVIPHGAIGAALLALDGADGSTSGPHVQITTDSDDYPVFQQLNWTHDNIALSFDAYFDGGAKSSDAGSNYRILKNVDLLKFQYDSGVAQGGTITWNNGISMNTSGDVVIKSSTFDGDLKIGGSGEVVLSGSLGVLRRDVDNQATRVWAATSGTDGAGLLFFGRDHATLPGDCYINIGGYDATGNMIFRHITTAGGQPTIAKMTYQGHLGINSVSSPSTALDIGGGAIEQNEMTAPAAGAANTTRTYTEDDSGTTRQQVKFSSGNATTIAKDGGLATYTPTNVTADRSYDADATSVAELADVLGTLIADFQAAGVLG